MKEKIKKIDVNKLIILFAIGSLLGFILEFIWIYILWRLKESHSSLVIGPFCIVYGFGIAVMYFICSFIEDKKIITKFFTFAFLGALVEYLCSLFQELIFHSRSWNYSNHFLNINGRTSLQMFLIWGLLGVLFIYFLYPLINKMFSKINNKVLKITGTILIIFFILDSLLTSLAVIRWNERLHDIDASNKIETVLDKYYDNDKMNKIFCNMHFN